MRRFDSDPRLHPPETFQNRLEPNCTGSNRPLPAPVYLQTMPMNFPTPYPTTVAESNRIGSATAASTDSARGFFTITAPQTKRARLE